jgi:hypothetical protein
MERAKADHDIVGGNGLPFSWVSDNVDWAGGFSQIVEALAQIQGRTSGLKCPVVRQES